jgi:integrase
MLPIQPFLSKLQAIGAAHKTILFYRGPLQKFAMHCPKQIEHVTADDVYSFLAAVRADGNSDYSVHNHCRVILHFLKKNGVVLDVMRPRFTEPIVDSYSPCQLKKLFAAARPDELRLFQFYLCSGCREGEVSHAMWSGLNFDAKTFAVEAQPRWNWRPKTHEGGRIPLPDFLLEMLRPLAGEGLIFPNKHGRPDGHHLKKLQALAKRSGQNPAEFGLHRFRRTFATMHHEAGVSANTIRTWLRHKDLASTLRYLQAADLQSERTRNLVNRTFVF